MSTNNNIKKKYIVGVDIGGTNTDAVLVDRENKILFAHKTTTTTSIEVGFKTVLETLLKISQVDQAEISGVFVGTTHATNALLQKRDLFRVGVIRASSATGNGLPPCYAWPSDLRESVFVGHHSVAGGFECDGRLINPLQEQEIKEALSALKEQGMESLGIVGVFSPLNPEQELTIETFAKEILGADFPITLSHRIGGVGFINRENATILNAALKRSMKNGFMALKNVLQELQLQATLHLTQNNGTILPLGEALEYPVLTISAGPTNSFIGSAKLSHLTDAVVVDVGGTSTDVGIVINGLPRRSVDSSSIGGVTLNFSMPDVLSIGLGGGSYVDTATLAVGPLSCAKNLKQEAQSFGGKSLTLTDIAVALKYIDLGSEQKGEPQITKELAQKIHAVAEQKIKDLTRIMCGPHKHLPIILTGGGSAIFKEIAAEGKTFLIPENAGVANAFGAALAEISGTIDTVVSLEKREETLAQLEQMAKDKAIDLGAETASLRIVCLEIIPYHYLPQKLARVKIVAAGKRNF